MRVVFMGTPSFAVTVLSKLVNVHNVIAVISQPDRAKDRKNNLLPTPVKAFASEKGIPVYQFDKIRQHADVLRGLNADIFVTAAYGQILSQEIIDIPRYGIVNVHASLLPELRGSSPIQSAILSGKKVTGVSIMQTALGMDAGDVLMSKEITIGDMTAGELSEALAAMGGDLLVEALVKIENGTIERTRQDESKATFCKKIDKQSAYIDFGSSASDLCNRIRAFNPDPVAFTFFGGERIKLYEAECVAGEGKAGEVLHSDRESGLVVACGNGAVRIKNLQPAGKRIMTDVEFINGKKISVGDYFGK